MATFNAGVLTDVGAQLMATAQHGSGSIIFTKLAVGSGTYTADEKTVEALKQRTNLKVSEQEYSVSYISEENPKQVRTSGVISNRDPETGTALFNTAFYINEIGLMAKLSGTNTEILYGIAVVTGDHGDLLQPFDGTNPVEIVQDFIAAVDNGTPVSVVYDGAAFALSRDFDAHAGTLAKSANGAHGIRLKDGKLEFYDPSTETWVQPLASSTVSGLMSNTDKVAHDKMIADIGNLTQLNTADKDSLVDAINEEYALLYHMNRRTRREIMSDRIMLLSTAVSEQNLAKYGFAIGDYFNGPSGYRYILGDMNTFKGTATPYCISLNHLGIVVDTHTTSQWHTGDASNVGLLGSVLYAYLSGTVLENIKSDFKVIFGGLTGAEHLIGHSKLLTTALANWTWVEDQYISPLTCTQIDAGSQWTANGFQEGEASKPLEIFRKYKWTEIFENEYVWLRNLSNYSGGSSACDADNYGGLIGSGGVTYAYSAVGLINFY